MSNEVEEVVSADSPLVKIERGEGGGSSAWIIAFIGFVLFVLFYAAGVVTESPAFSAASMVVIVVFSASYLIARRKIRQHEAPMSDEEIERKVSEYKKDLADTFDGYGVPFDRHDIMVAADEYREHLVSESISVADFDPSSMLSVIRSMVEDSRRDKQSKKEYKSSVRRQVRDAKNERMIVRKQSKKAKAVKKGKAKEPSGGVNQ